jgi:catechol 2,3-dioxygenase-like lactoylglutathione lyase family enzyme
MTLIHATQPKEPAMTNPIPAAGVHHIALTVSDVRRSQQFYTDLLGFKVLAEFGPRVLLHNGSVIIGLTPPPDPAQAIPADRFNENRIGLDHLSLSVASMADLEAAVALCDAKGVDHGEIKALAPFGIAVLALRDPDNIQLELTAPLG